MLVESSFLPRRKCCETKVDIKARPASQEFDLGRKWKGFFSSQNSRKRAHTYTTITTVQQSLPLSIVKSMLFTGHLEADPTISREVTGDGHVHDKWCII